jgi:uncharacterized membrane protein
MQQGKIEDLSNLVFGLALALGAINLVAPSRAGLVPLLQILANFGLSFSIIIWIWLVYNSLVAEQDMGKRGRLAMNILLLFLVVIEPFLLSVSLGEGVSSSAGRSAYAIDLGFAVLILGLFSHFAMTEERLVPDQAARRRMRTGRNLSFLCSAVFFLSLVPPLLLGDIGIDVQVTMWFAALAIVLVSRVRRQRIL